MVLIQAESDNNKTSLVVKGWALHKQDMDRLRAAVQRASAASDGTTEPVEALQTGHSDFKSINLSIEDKTWYRIPREACFPWNVCMRPLSLKHSHRMLTSLAHGSLP